MLQMWTFLLTFFRVVTAAFLFFLMDSTNFLVFFPNLDLQVTTKKKIKRKVLAYFLAEKLGKLIQIRQIRWTLENNPENQESN